MTTALTLYRGTSLTLERAATQSGISPAELESQLRSRGVPVPDGEHVIATDRARN